MIDQPERLRLESLDMAEDRIALLREDFPEVFRDGKIDFDALKRTLGDWIEPGKAEAFQAVQTPSVATLLPDRDGSVDWESTQNLIIEGDNLEVLKLLQKSYYGKVKMIYIDPPYNTGNDFIYPDNYREGLQSYLEFTGQVNGEGKKLSTNTETAGRYHSNWLNMMYPRLFLARNLLRDDGVIFVSIDDTEVGNLRALLSEVFGEDNLLSHLVWQKTYSPANDKQGVDAMHDHILMFAKSVNYKILLLPRDEKQNKAYTNPDTDPRGPWKAENATRSEYREYAYYAIRTPSGKMVLPPSGRSWVFNKEDLPRLVAERRLWFGKNGDSKPSLKRFLYEVKQGVVPTSWWSHEVAGHNDESMKELKRTFGEDVGFGTPKPTRLVQRMLSISVDPISTRDEIVLDFFSGSGSTGHAVMKQNAEDGGNRKYILVQLPEPIDPPKVLDDGTELATIADITRERVRRAGRHITGG